jgi:hypothetical protein
VTPAFFTPALHQQATLRLTLGDKARVAVSVLDRDRVAVRHLPPQEAERGELVVRWDGRDDDGSPVPSEAYTFRVEAAGVAGAGGSVAYDASEGFVPQTERPAIRSYSRTEGVVSYTLAHPSRVHIHAGQAQPNRRTGEMDGPILKTVVDREPRVAGAVVEIWNGMDESGTIRVPALPHFAMAILATTLPENVVIVAGTGGPSFAAYVRAHRSAAALRPRSGAAAAAAHHAGLSGLEDHSPQVTLVPQGTWDPRRRMWSVAEHVRARVAIPSDQAPYFLAQPQTLTAFVDEVAVLHLEHPGNPQEISIPGKLRAGEHRLVVNWTSSLGPVGLAATRIVAREMTASASSKGKAP